MALQIYYAFNPFVGTGHQFFLNSRYLPSMCILAFSGLAVGLDPGIFTGTVYSNPTSSITTIQPGSVTPSANGELIITALNQGPDTMRSDYGCQFSRFHRNRRDAGCLCLAS
jgi:hypothetical protein